MCIIEKVSKIAASGEVSCKERTIDRFNTEAVVQTVVKGSTYLLVEICLPVCGLYPFDGDCTVCQLGLQKVYS